MYAGHAVASTGHCHPKVVAAIKEQAERMIFYSTAANVRVREEAAECILRQAPAGLGSVFFVNSGTEANEAALRLAVAKTGRKKIIAMENGFHGRTLLSLNSTGIAKYRALAPFAIEEISFAKFGDAGDVLGRLDNNTAAVIMEPVQGMAGAVTVPDDFFTEVREAASRNGTFLIFDEVQTAPGRTGSMFFSGNPVTPDMITLAKGIASGIPAGAVIVSDKIASTIRYGELGSTFGGGPVACSAIKATFEVIEKENLLDNVRAASRMLIAGLVGIDGILSVSGKGLLLGIRLNHSAAEVQNRLLELGVIVGTAEPQDTIRILPPLTIGADEISSFIERLRNALG